MKKAIFLLTALFMLGIMNVSFAQAGTNGVAAKSASATKSAKAKKYYCTKCNYSSTKAGKCPTDHASLVKDGTYYCPSCNMTSTKAGECGMCHEAYVKMDGKKKRAGNESEERD